MSARSKRIKARHGSRKKHYRGQAERMLEAAERLPGFNGDFCAIAASLGWNNGPLWQLNPSIRLARDIWDAGRKPCCKRIRSAAGSAQWCGLPDPHPGQDCHGLGPSEMPVSDFGPKRKR